MQRFPAFELSEVAAQLGHRLRNPLATIASGIQLAQLLARPEGEAADCLAEALEEVGRIDHILKDFQRLARLVAGPPVQVGLRELAERAAAACTAPGLRALRLEGPAGPEVLLDAELLVVALGALLERAAAVTPAGEDLLLQWGEGEACTVWFEVADSGSGDTSGSLASLLAAWPGSGLGAQLVARACSLLGGWLEWEAVQPCGHRLRIVLKRG